MNTPDDNFVDSRDFARIAKAIHYIDAHYREQPSLTTIAGHTGLSEFHFNRLFRRWAGVTPKQYLAFVTGRYARNEIASQSSVLDAAYAVGLSGPSRLHDLIVTLDAVTPGELKSCGRGITLHYGFTETPFGEALLAASTRGLSHLAFVDADERDNAFSELRAHWRNADLHRDDARARDFAIQIWGESVRGARKLRLHVAGTNFQLKVWQALLDSGPQSRTTYSALAKAMGEEGSARAVGNAVGANPVGWLIPCHTVLRRDGALGGYHWGEDRKRAILAWDSLKNETLVPVERVNGGVRA
jgi:AraC family transcriptional regulator, regulatory protein of adaptative response / methylated-DNA-[protein]-cysteine methyltransferase